MRASLPRLKNQKHAGHSLSRCPLCASRLLPGADGGSPARRGAWGERENPLYTPCTPVPPIVGNAKLFLGRTVPHPPRVAWGIGANLPGPVGPGDVRACCGAPSALRAHGIAFAPATRCISGKGRKGATLPGGSECEKLADGRTVFPHVRGKLRSFLDAEGSPLCFAVFRAAAFSVPLRFTFFKVETL